MDKRQIVEFLVKYPDKFGKMVGFDRLSKIHREWIRMMLFSEKDETLQASRGTYKTTCVSLALALNIILHPNKRTMFMRKTDGDVKEVIKQVYKILENPRTQYIVQSIYDVNLKFETRSVGEITTNLTTDSKGTSQLIGIGTGSSLTGKHFDCIFTDDIVNINDRISRTEREHTKLIYQELQNIKNRGGHIFNTGTPWHKDDCFSIMPNIVKYNCYHEEVKKIISEDELKELKESMLPSLFSANYELRHIASEDIIFPNPQTGADTSKIEQARYIHVDASYGGEDYTACTIIKKYDGKIYALGKMWHKHVDNCIDEMIELRKKYNVAKFICEKNADKGYLAKELRKQGERAVTYHEDMNKFLKITSYLKGDWKNVIFVEGTDEDYIQQIEDYNENAEHDDAPDSLASLIRKLYYRKEV